MKIICIIGEFATGKSSIFKRLKNHPLLQGVVTHTSRPMRSNEKDGVDYHFVTDEEFDNMINNDEMVEYNVFNDWYYGSTYKAFECNDANKLIVLNPTGYFKLREQYGEDNVLGIVVHRNTRDKALSYLYRDENADVYEMCRRLQTDKQDFHNINNSNYKNTYHVDNETGKFDECVSRIDQIVEKWLEGRNME